MLKERARIIALAVFMADLTLVACAFVAAHWLRDALLLQLGAVTDRIYPLSAYLPLLPLMLLVWALSFWSFSLYRSHRTVPFFDEVWELLKSCVVATVLLILAIFFLRIDQQLLAGDR